MHSLINELRAAWQSRSLVWVLARREVAARHAGTAAGVLWPYLQPLLTVAAYYLVFDVVFSLRLGPEAPVPQVGMFLVVGALPWIAFCDAIARGMNSLVEGGSVLQKNPLPPVLFVARAVLASSVIYGPLILGLALAYAPSHGFNIPLLSLLPLLGLQVLLTLLLSYLLAILAAALRDTIQIVTFMLSVGIYLTPVLFPISLFPEGWRWILYLNPMTAFVLSYQDVLLQSAWPQPLAWAIIAAWIVVVSVVLNVAIRRSRDQLVDWL